MFSWFNFPIHFLSSEIRNVFVLFIAQTPWDIILDIIMKNTLYGKTNRDYQNEIELVERLQIMVAYLLKGDPKYRTLYANNKRSIIIFNTIRIPKRSTFIYI